MKETIPIKLNESIIPKGHYCYEYFKNGPVINKWCPYHQYLKVNDNLSATVDDDIYITYCIFLKEGSIHNNTTDEQFDRIKEYFGFKTDDDLFDSELFGSGADLLWDGCKECGINYGDEDDETF